MKAPSAGHRFGDFFRSPAKENEIDAQDAKCKHCGHAYGNHGHKTLECPNYDSASPMFLDDQFFAPVTAKDETYAESIAKIADSMSFLVIELQDAHGAAPNVGTQIVLMDYLEKIVKIKTDVNRLKAETKGA